MTPKSCVPGRVPEYGELQAILRKLPANVSSAGVLQRSIFCGGEALFWGLTPSQNAQIYLDGLFLLTLIYAVHRKLLATFSDGEKGITATN